MARPRDPLPDLTALARPGAGVAVRVTPRAARARIELEGGAIRLHVTEAPEDGRATEAARALLAAAMGVAKTRLTLVRGATSREKCFRLEG